MEDAVMPLAHREVEAEGVHEPTMRTLAISRWDSDLVWPTAINRGGAQLAFPPAHTPFPIDSMFSFCSHNAQRESNGECGGRDHSSPA
jgi:hypothetical protein